MIVDDRITLDIDEYHDLMTRATYGDMVESLIQSLPVGLEDMMIQDDGTYTEEYLAYLMWADPERWQELVMGVADEEYE